jgi:hypothetical protein
MFFVIMSSRTNDYGYVARRRPRDLNYNWLTLNNMSMIHDILQLHVQLVHTAHTHEPRFAVAVHSSAAVPTRARNLKHATTRSM